MVKGVGKADMSEALILVNLSTMTKLYLTFYIWIHPMQLADFQTGALQKKLIQHRCKIKTEASRKKISKSTAVNTKRVDRNHYQQQTTDASNLLGMISVITLRILYGLQTPIK